MLKVHFVNEAPEENLPRLVFLAGEKETSRGFVSDLESRNLPRLIHGKSSASPADVCLPELPEKMEDIMPLGRKTAELCTRAGLDSFIVEGKGVPVPLLINFLESLILGDYRFAKFRDGMDTLHFSKLYICVDRPEACAKAWREVNVEIEGVLDARELTNLPPNVLSPESFAEFCVEEFPEVRVLDRAALEDMGFRTLLAVARASKRQPRVVVISYKGKGAEESPPVLLVGKGVCFDSGGLNLKKSANHLANMHDDMAGAATVVGVMKTLTQWKLPVHVVGIVGLVENMLGGDAYRPSDIITSLSGKTIKILNTDAEGRLVLADLLWYGQKTYGPKVVIDFATLTGAIGICLAHVYAGLFSNDDALAQSLIQAGEDSGERLWRLPVGSEFTRFTRHSHADLANIPTGLPAGHASSTLAAEFLRQFIMPDVAWAHLDIAGVATDEGYSGLVDHGATGFGVRLINRWFKTRVADL